MSELALFYAQNAVAVELEELVVSDRFKAKDGSPVPWKLRGMTEAENEECRKASTRRTKGKNGQSVAETDTDEYLAKLVVASVVFPNMKDAELQKSYGVLGAENLLRKMLLPGEYAALVGKVQDLNGFNRSITELVDEVKN